MVCMLVAAYCVAVKRGYPAGTLPGLERGVALDRRPPCPACWWSAIILGGILSGVFTATESAAVAVIYALLLTFFVYRTHDVGELPARPRPRR